MFVHLRSHSSYSLLLSTLHLEQLARLCQEDGMPAIALTDYGNLFGALEFSELMSSYGIQPIIGCSLPVSFEGLEKPTVGTIAVLAKNECGYRHLMVLSELFSRNDRCISSSQLYAHEAGLICLTGGFDGPLHQLIAAGREADARAVVRQLIDVFSDRLYIELQRHDMPEERAAEPFLLQQAAEFDMPVVATHEPYFSDTSFYEVHDTLLAVSEGKVVEDASRRRLTRHHRFTSQEEMRRLFQDVPEAIEATVEVAKRVGFRVLPSLPQLPMFVSDEVDGQMLRDKARAGLAARLKAHKPFAPLAEYESRLSYEIDVIARMNFSGYYLIVSDFILWAKGKSIPVGPGRGSGAGSLVAWSLFITELDPLRFGLLFERFLNPERVSLPDFDVDFCQERRDEVIEYVREKHGRERVAHIITFGKMQARAVLRDVGRALGMPYGQVDRICKLVPFNPAHPSTLQESIDGEPKLQQERDADPTVARLIEISLKLEGLYRHASVHAAGVVIGRHQLRGVVPLYTDARSSLVTTQFSMKWVEKAGLVKFDFLGLKTLTVIAKVCELLRSDGIDIDPNTLPLDDPQAFAMLSRGETMGVFQLEATSMRDVLRKMKPDRLEDIIALVALNRPGPMDNIPRYINCKNGLERPDYLHEKLKPILEETFGIIVYQEQVMQIAQVLSGYSPGDADLLRRAMGKKVQEEMNAQRETFIQGAQRNGVAARRAASIFDSVSKFAGYGFNKSHAAAYALISYQTAYLKANYPLVFMAAIMTLDMGNTEKLRLHREEMVRLGFKLYPPDVNQSDVAFVPTNDAQGKACIYYGLGAIKNVGSQAMEKLVRIRQESGPFSDVYDFLVRCGRVLNKKSLENMIYAGALDCLHAHRAQLIANVDALLKYASAHQVDSPREGSRQMSLFDQADFSAISKPSLADVPALKPADALHQEFLSVGFYLSDHPLRLYAEELRGRSVLSFSDFCSQRLGSGQLAGVVAHVRTRKSRQDGGTFAFVTLSDQTGQFDFILFGRPFDEAREVLVEGALLLVEVEAEWPADPDGVEGDIDGSVDRSVKPRMRALAVRDLRRSATLGQKAPHGNNASALPHRVALSEVSAQRRGVHVTLSDPRALAFLKKHVKAGGSHEVRVTIPGLRSGEEVYQVELLLGTSLDAHALIQFLENGERLPFEGAELI